MSYIQALYRLSDAIHNNYMDGFCAISNELQDEFNYCARQFSWHSLAAGIAYDDDLLASVDLACDCQVSGALDTHCLDVGALRISLSCPVEQAPFAKQAFSLFSTWLEIGDTYKENELAFSRLVLANCDEAAFCIDRSGAIGFVNQKAETLGQFSQHDVIELNSVIEQELLLRQLNAEVKESFFCTLTDRFKACITPLQQTKRFIVTVQEMGMTTSPAVQYLN